METEKRIACFDDDLGIEATHFKGIMQKFPNHFHEHYVIGFVESGRRFLACKNQEYVIDAGDLILFNPLEAHTCEQADGKTLDWRCLNIEKEVMGRIAAEITGVKGLPVFTSTVARQSDMVPLLRELHGRIVQKDKGFDKEETVYFLLEQLIAAYTAAAAEAFPQTSREILAACAYMENHYAESISLADLSRTSGFSKYTFLRIFTAQKGITPYQYLSTIRVNQAKKLLEEGLPLAEAAMRAGFADQSHFTRFFKTFIGLTPKLYQNLFQSVKAQPSTEVRA